MRITGVRWSAYRIPFRAPYVTSRGSVTRREGLIVELTAEGGRVGLGEAAPVPEAQVTGETLARAFEPIAARLPGYQVDGRFAYSPMARPPAMAAGPGVCERALACALDVAFCDLVAQHRRVGVAELLSPYTARRRVEVNALVTAGRADDAVSAAAAAVSAGYRTLKLKVGVAQSVAEEVERVAAVRGAIGPDVSLRLDPNGAWSVGQAVEMITALETCDIEYVEQPVPAGDLRALRSVQKRVAVDVAADEDVTGRTKAHRIVEIGAARVIVLKPQRLRGIDTMQSIVDDAYAANLPRCVVTTSIETGVGTAACLHLAATLPPGSPACGLATASLLESDLTAAPIAVIDGTMLLPPGAGLGVTLDEAALARYTDGWREAG